MISTSTMNATPAMCHHAEIEFKSDVMLTANRFSTSAIAITTVYVTKIQCLLFG